MCFHGPVCNPVEKSHTARRKPTGDRRGSVETNVDRTHTQKRLPLRAKRYFHLTHSYFLQLIPAIVCASMCGVFRLTLWTPPITTANLATFPRGNVGFQPTGNTDPYGPIEFTGNAQYGNRGGCTRAPDRCSRGKTPERTSGCRASSHHDKPGRNPLRARTGP